MPSSRAGRCARPSKHQVYANLRTSRHDQQKTLLDDRSHHLTMSRDRICAPNNSARVRSAAGACLGTQIDEVIAIPAFYCAGNRCASSCRDGSPTSQKHTKSAAIAPTICAAMNGMTSNGRMPAKVLDSARAIVTAGLANEVDAVNQ